MFLYLEGIGISALVSFGGQSWLSRVFWVLGIKPRLSDLAVSAFTC